MVGDRQRRRYGMSRLVREPMNAARLLLFALTLAPMALLAGSCAERPAAPAYPSKPIEAVVVFSAGGSQDRIGRLLMPLVAKKWGQPINVVNKTGAAGATGTVAVLQSPADGYTIGMFGDANGYLGHAVQNMPYQWGDINHIAMVAVQPLVLVVKSDSRFSSLQDVVTEMKRAPDQLSFASSGVAGPSTFAISQLAQLADVDPRRLKRVTFDGGAPAVTAVAGGHVDMAAQYGGEVIELIRGGQLKPLAVILPQRWSKLPDTPTFAELGYGSTDAAGRGPVGVFGPANLPAEVVKKWEDILAEMVKDPEFLAGLEEIGGSPLYLNSKDFRAYVEKEYQSAFAIAERLGIRQ
jgi:tripartite-type tricarboxylate transporter receptor subunit TctC